MPKPESVPAATAEGTVTRAVAPLFVFAVGALAVWQLSRAGLVAWQLDRVSATGGLGVVFLRGLRFDTVALGFVAFWPAVLVVPLLAWRRTFRPAQVALAGILASLLVGIVLLEFATPSFIEEYDTRPNYLFVEYLEYPGEVLATLWGAYAGWLIVAIVGLPLLWIFAARVLGRVGRLAGPLPAPRAAAVTALLAVLCALGARSSLDHRAINPSVACYSSDAMVNTLPLNSAYSLGYAIYEMNKHEREASYGELPYDEVLDIVRAASGVDAAAFADPTIPTLHRQVPSRPRGRPLNLVIVLEESLGAEFVGSMGGLPLTPNLDRLLTEGLAFDRLYATGTRSVRGIEAVVTGFYPTPSLAVVKLPRSQRDFFTLPALLRDHGYATSFLYGGDASFDNMGRFFSGNGVERIIDRDDFPDPYFSGSWGVSDQDLFRRAHAEFEAAGDRPFFSLVFSTSNHTPWDFPAGEIELFEEPAATRNNAVKYADHALGEFFELARGSSYWDDTLFLVVADHNSRVYGPELVPVERFHVPGVFLGGTVSPGRISTLASQVDLLPTALSLIGFEGEHPALGRDLSDPVQRAAPGRALLQFHHSFLYLEDEQAVLLRPEMKPVHLLWNGETLRGDPGPATGLERQALAHALWPSLSYRFGDYRLPDPRTIIGRRSRDAAPRPRTADRAQGRGSSSTASR